MIEEFMSVIYGQEVIHRLTKKGWEYDALGQTFKNLSDARRAIKAAHAPEEAKPVKKSRKKT